MTSDTDILALVHLLRVQGLKISFAESCTGGMASEMLTSIPGVSDVFLGSAVTYSNESKEAILGVSHDTLMEHGAVSEECAKEMALGSLKAYGSDIAVSVTGIAGPDGATYDKPVGLVYIAATNGKDFISSANRFFGDRHDIRLASVNAMFRDAIRLIGGF
jgi:PncC family amidohydrolase